MFTDYTIVSIYTLLFPTRCSTLLDCWNMMKIEGARKAPLKPCKHWMGITAVSWSVFCSLWLFLTAIYYGNTRSGLQLKALSRPIQLSGEFLEQFKAFFPVLPAHRTHGAGHSILRNNHAGAKAWSWSTWNKQFKTNSFRMSSSKFIHTSQAHQLKRNIHVYIR